jgi:tRNA-dihydrouridine synthase A
VRQLIPYVEAHLARGGRLSNVTRHILGLYHGCPRGRLFRRVLSEGAVKSGAGVEVLEEALGIAEGRGSGRVSASSPVDAAA